MDDFKKGIEKAKEIYRTIHRGGCRIISKGDDCDCFLCRCDNEVEKRLDATGLYFIDATKKETDKDSFVPSSAKIYQKPQQYEN
jgi:hypothetical protein